MNAEELENRLSPFFAWFDRVVDTEDFPGDKQKYIDENVEKFKLYNLNYSNLNDASEEVKARFFILNNVLLKQFYNSDKTDFFKMHKFLKCFIDFSNYPDSDDYTNLTEEFFRVISESITSDIANYDNPDTLYKNLYIYIKEAITGIRFDTRYNLSIIEEIIDLINNMKNDRYDSNAKYFFGIKRLAEENNNDEHLFDALIAASISKINDLDVKERLLFEYLDKYVNYIRNFPIGFSDYNQNRVLETFNTVINSFPNMDDRVRLCRKVYLYRPVFDGQESLSCSLINKVFVEASKKPKEIDKILPTFKKVLDDRFLSGFLTSHTISSLFDYLTNDDVLIEKYNELINDSVLSKFFDEHVFSSFVHSLSNPNTKVKFLMDGYNNDLIKERDTIPLLFELKNKESLLDYELMETFYKTYKNNMSIAFLSQGKRVDLDVNRRFKEEEEKYISEGRLEELLNKYKTIGQIDDSTLKVVYEVVSKYINNLTYEDMLNRLSKSPNTIEIVKHLAFINRLSYVYRDEDNNLVNAHKGDLFAFNLFEHELKKFEIMFSKCRFGRMIDYESYSSMTDDMISKFDLKIWDSMISNPLFNKDSNTKDAMLQIIAMAGLFEKDPYALERKKSIDNLFSYAGKIVTREDLHHALGLEIDDYSIMKDIFEPVTYNEYYLRDGVVIPLDIRAYFSNKLSQKRMTKLMRETGNLGSNITKFISPYLKTDKGYELKTGIDISSYKDYLKPVMSTSEYEELLNNDNTPSNVINFINPYKQVTCSGFRITDKINDPKDDYYLYQFRTSNINSIYNYEVLHRVFDSMELTYDKDFYDFFMDNQEEILENPLNQSYLKDIKQYYERIIDYYKERGNQSPTYQDMLTFIKEIPYKVTFGNEEFAIDAKNAEVTDEGYSYYEKLLNKTRTRYLTTLPRHEKVYTYKSADGKEYKILTKILRSDDPFNLLVGEKKFTNCCQRYGLAGEACMEHASTNPNGGIFVTYLLNDDNTLSLLTQSWLWVNETKACLDNVEATSLIDYAVGPAKKDLQAAVRYAIKSAGKDIIDTSKREVNNYVEDHLKRVKASNKSEEEKKQEINKLEQIRTRQILNKFTVGQAIDDIAISSEFKEKESDENSYGPKGYYDYRDSEEGHQYVIVKGSSKDIEPDDNYKEVPIYRDDRRISKETGKDIKYSTLRMITDIGEEVHREEMVNYIDERANYTIRTPEYFANFFNSALDDINVIHGEDWYIIYTVEEDEIKIHDIARRNPRIYDEGVEQTGEIIEGLNKILEEAVVLDDNNNLEFVKPINADLREDTAYLIYLVQKHRDKITQVEEDYKYRYEDIFEMEPVSVEEQNDILKNYNEIKENGNPELYMHRVKFTPSKKEIEKIIEKKTSKEIEQKKK